MSDNEVFLSLIGGAVAALLGGLLVIPIRMVLRATDGGDDLGWGLLWIVLMIFSGIVGFALSAKWVRKRHSDKTLT